MTTKIERSAVMAQNYIVEDLIGNVLVCPSLDLKEPSLAAAFLWVPVPRKTDLGVAHIFLLDRAGRRSSPSN